LNERKISDAVVTRLPRYYRYLRDLQLEGIERISSDELSHRMGVTASQIRQDLNNFGGFGQQGYGYNVSSLKEEIGKILALQKIHNLIIIGGGNLGKALAGYSKFESSGFEVKAIFDISDQVVGTEVRGIKVLHLDDLESFLTENSIDIATLAIPKATVNEVAKRLYNCGIRAFWNFAHLDLEIPSDAYVENMHLIDHLMKLSYRLNREQGE